MEPEAVVAEIYWAAGGCAAVPMPLDVLIDRLVGDSGFGYLRAVPIDDAALVIEGPTWRLLVHPDAAGDTLLLAVARGIARAWGMLRQIHVTRETATAIANELLAPSPAIRLARQLGFEAGDLQYLFGAPLESLPASAREALGHTTGEFPASGG